MNQYFIFPASDYSEEKEIGLNYAVIYCPGQELDVSVLQDEIREYFEKHHHADRLIIIGGADQTEQLLSVFRDSQTETFKYLPKVSREYRERNIYIYCFQHDGELTAIHNEMIEPRFNLSRIIHSGLQYIFISQGGLVESTGAHHFIFPSGKHCAQFLRTGNILLYGSEIYFIAFALLPPLRPGITRTHLL
jgi:hypothetical protein